jgi:signal transduction histidine kinase
VTRTLTPALHRLGVLIGLMALVAIVGVLLSTRAVNDLTEELQPAAAANQDVLLDLTSMEGSVANYARSGDTAAVDEYDQVLARLPGDQREVRTYAEGDSSLSVLVANQEAAISTWLEDYAQPRVAAPGGPETFQPRRYRLGQRLFADVLEAHRATSAAFGDRVRQASSDASWRLRGTVGAVALLALLAWLVVARSRSRMLSEVADPMVELEHVVLQMAKDPTLRAHPDGPRELRSIIEALNGLADAQARSLAVESKIQASLRTLDTAKDDFVSNVSHELRTPLTTISGYLEVVAEEFEDVMSPRHARILEASRRNVARLKSLIDDLLTLSRAETRHTDLESADLVPLVRDAVTDVRITAAGRGITVAVDAPKHPVLVLADRAMLGRALLNVLSNAVKFSLDDTTVEVEVATAAQHVVVRVRDHGIGIPEAELERLGTRFFRASNAVTNEIAGTGLGIRIVQTIVDKHAGELRFESQEGRGTTVTLRLPLLGDPTAADPSARPAYVPESEPEPSPEPRPEPRTATEQAEQVRN